MGKVGADSRDTIRGEVEVVFGRRSGSQLLRKTWALPVVLLSGALMLISAGLPAAAAPAGQQRGLFVEAGRESAEATATSVDECPDVVAQAGSPTGKVGYAPPTSAGTDVDPLDLFTLDTGDGHVDGLPADSAWATTDPDRGPPATRQ